MIKKVVRRSVKRDKLVFLAINIMILITIILSVLSLLSYGVGYKNFQNYKEDINLENFQMQTINPLSEKEIKTIENDYNLDIETNYKYVNKSGDTQITLYQYIPDNKISNFKLIEGSDDLHNNQIILSSYYAEANDIKVGDTIKIANQNLEVIGLDFSPEDIYPIKEGGFLPENDTVAVGYVNEKTLDKISLGKEIILYRGKFNDSVKDKSQVYQDIKNDLQVEVVETNILNQVTDPTKTVEMSNVVSLIDYKSNMNIGMLELEYMVVSIMMLALGIVIGIITVILSLFLFRNIVERQRREIGILRAFGIYQKEIMNEYSKLFTKFIIVDCILGIIIGSFSYYQLSGLYAQFFNFIDYKVSIASIILLIIIVVIESIILLVCVRYFAVKKNLSINVLNMVKNIQKEKKPKKVRFRFKSFKRQLKFNTIIRNYSKTVLLIYGIVFSTFLLVFALSAIASINDMQQNVFGDEFSYTYESVFSPDFTPDPKLYNDESIIYMLADMDNGDTKSSVSVIGYNTQNPTININEDENLRKHEAYITSHIADTYGLSIGDSVTIYNPRNSKERYDFVVKEIADNKAEDKIYVNIDYLHNIFDLEDDYYNGYVGANKTKQEIDQGNKNMVYYSVSDIIDGIASYSTLINVMIIYIAVFAFVISLIALTVITSIIIKNNEKTISLMKVLGYKTKEINNSIISGYRPIVIVTYIIIFPISIEVLKLYLDFIFSLVENLNYPMVIEANFSIFVIGFIIILISFELTLLLSKRKINKIKLSEVLSKDE